MACNVFGNPITDSTLAGMPEYARKIIEGKHRARVAYNMKNAESKDVNALRFLEKLQKESSTTGQVFTLCLVYNATGDALKYVSNRDWHGHIGLAPYPVEIANGQWGAFLHVGVGLDGSQGAVVYRTKNETAKHDWMISWFHPTKGRNRVFSDLMPVDHFTGDHAWPGVKNKLENHGRFRTEVYEGYETTVCIGQDLTSIYEAIITLQD